MADLLLGWMAAYGVPVLAMALLAQSLGLPIPAGLLVLAAGASVRRELMDWQVAAALCLAAAVVGDCACYLAGRTSSAWVRGRMGRRCRSFWLRAEEQLRRRGAVLVYLTRVVLTPLELATNLVAGSSRYPFRRFLACVATGRLTWIGLYGGLGYALGGHWQSARQAIDGYGPWLGGIAIGCFGLFVAARNLRQRPWGATAQLKEAQ